MDDRYLRSSATAVSVGHRREMDDGLLPMVHDKCGSSFVANTTATEPSVRPGSKSGSGRVTTCRFRCRFPLFRGGGGSVCFVGPVSVV